LLVWCHGPGDDERQVQRVMPLISMRNYVAVAPRGVSRRSSEPGFSWGEDEESTQMAQQRVLDAIQLARSRFHIAADRIFLAGLHCGGTMALRIGLRNSGRFAGLASIGGGLPQGRMPLRDLRQLRNLPLFVAYNRDSRRYTVEQSCADLRLVHAAGIKLHLHQYPCGDELTTKMLSDLNVWLMERVTGQSAQADVLPESTNDWN
jgi:phospholipase/carboxylesterase